MTKPAPPRRRWLSGRMMTIMCDVLSTRTVGYLETRFALMPIAPVQWWVMIFMLWFVVVLVWFVPYLVLLFVPMTLSITGLRICHRGAQRINFLKSLNQAELLSVMPMGLLPMYWRAAIHATRYLEVIIWIEIYAGYFGTLLVLWMLAPFGLLALSRSVAHEFTIANDLLSLWLMILLTAAPVVTFIVLEYLYATVWGALCAMSDLLPEAAFGRANHLMLFIGGQALVYGGAVLVGAVMIAAGLAWLAPFVCVLWLVAIREWMIRALLAHTLAALGSDRAEFEAMIGE
jgi:hypothetical protein